AGHGRVGDPMRRLRSRVEEHAHPAQGTPRVRLRAISWYQQRIAIEPEQEARAIMENAQSEEFKHFGMDLEFLLRRTPKWRIALQDILFKSGDIVEHGEEAEEDSG